MVCVVLVIVGVVGVVALAAENTATSVGWVMETCGGANGVKPPSVSTASGGWRNLHGFAEGRKYVVAAHVLGWDSVDFFKTSFDGGNKVFFVNKWEESGVEKGLRSGFGGGVGSCSGEGVEDVVGSGLANDLRVTLVCKV